MVTLRIFLFVVLANLLAAAAHATTSPVGTTPGKFSVSNNGAATYTVPIQIPPGINGVEPKLALVYNSQQGNGLLGVGWSLSGLSTIVRCPKTLAVDSVRSGINFSGSEFCWDGQRLIPKTISGAQDTGSDTTGTYWEFRTEIETFSRVRAYTSLTAPSQFKIWTKDGRLLTFGATTDSNVKPQGKGTLVWAINREEDRKGNYITFTYSKTAGDSEYYPASIQYGGADSTVLARSIVFGMDTTARLDTSSKYISGALITSTQRLKTITTKLNGVTVRIYTLNYNAEATTAARSLLSSIQECGNDTICYSTPLSFTPRSAGATSFSNGATASLVPGTVAGATYTQWNLLADVNGDGIMDIFEVTGHTTGTVTVLLGKAGGGYNAGVSTAGVMTDETTPGSGFNQWNELADVNGDGILDIFRVITPSSGSVAVYLGKSGGTFNTTPISLTGVVAYDAKGFRYLNQLIDMNGDGLMDLFSASGQNGIIRYGLISGSYALQAPVTKTGILAPYTAGSAEGFRATNQLADVNGDGLIDVIQDLNPAAGAIGVAIAQTDGSFTTTTTSGVLAPSGTWGGYANYLNYLNQFVDVNGDGVLDVVRMDAFAFQPVNPPTDYGILVQTGTTTTTVVNYGGGSSNTTYTTPKYYSAMANAGTTLKTWLGNGAGSFVSGPTGATINMGSVQFTPTGGAITASCTGSNTVTDNVVNTDGFHTYTYVSENHWNCTPTSYSVSDSSFKGLSHLNQFADMDGDGYVDLIQIDTSGGVSISFGKGDGSFPSQINSLATVVATSGFRAWNQLADLNGDGVVDLFAVSSTTGTPKISQRAQPGLMASASDGNGLVTSITYQPLSNTTAYTKSATIDAYPLRKVQMPQYVVTASTDAQGSFFSYGYNYQYTDARVDLTRGWLGFASVARTDLKTSLQTTTTFNQSFPYTGRPSLQTVHPTGATAGQYLSSTAYNWLDRADTSINSSGKVHFVYPTGNTQTVYEPTNNYAAILTTTTTYLDNPGTGNYDSTPYDQFGNPEKITVSYSDGHSLATVYGNAYLTSALYLGQLSQQDTTVTHTTPGAETKVRVTRGSYSTDGLLQTTISQPNTTDTNHELSLTSTYGYDTNGRVTSLSVAGADPSYDASGNVSASPVVTRTTGYSYATETTTSLTVTKTTAVSGSSSHTETSIYDPRYGTQSGYTDPAGVATTWGYDGFGRKVLEKRYSSSAQPVSTVIDFFASTDTTNCPAVTGLGYCARATTSGTATTLSAVTTEYDALGRELRTLSKDASGQSVYKDTQYDLAGRVWKVSRPYYSGTAPVTTTTYDIAGRPTVITAPNTATTTNTYNGLTTTVTRAASGEVSQVTKTVKDSQGQITQITDALSNITTYAFGPFGMLETITDTNGNVITLGYDIFGNKISQNDADSGLWLYRYNAFGELKWQKDALGQITAYQYDYRGRMINRTDAAGVATVWTYDTVPGRLDNVVRGSGATAVTQSYTYDLITRQVKTFANTLNGSTYQAQTDYDDLGRPQVITYPGTALKIKYSYYANGSLKDVTDATSSALYWSATTYNADGLPTAESWGNTLTGTRAYDPNTGALTGITTGTVQNLSYGYYKLGNLNTRTNGLNSVTETFSYDPLNRLTDVTSTAAGVPAKHYGFDAIGNITSKTGVGSYTYGGPRPHAVTSIAPSGATSGDADGDGTLTTADTAAILNNILKGTALTGNGDCNSNGQTNVLDYLCVNARIVATTLTYNYDANGNMVSGAGRAISYTAFNMPYTVDYNGVRETYTYGPDYARISKQVSGTVTQTTTYLGKLYEHIDRSGTVEDRFYISAGDRLVAEVSKSGGTTNTYYVHSDLLGSAETVTDSTKAVVDNVSFDAWGLPRQANWQDGAPASAFNKTTRGYTGHETDIASGLVNMNARLYDPVIGRFVQADSIIPTTFNPQSFNRYSYAVNNPFIFIDPTGHEFIQAADGYSTFDGSPNGDTVVYVAGTGAFYFSDGSMITGNGGYVSAGSAAAGYNSTRNWGNCVGSECGSSSDPSYKLIGPDNSALYDVVMNDGTATVIGAPDHLSGGHVAVNGQSNSPEKALWLMATHVGADDRAATQFSLVYNPTFETTYGSMVGGILDTLESVALKAGFNTPTSDLIASELRYASEQGLSLDWTVHSQGHLEFLQGASQAGVNLAGNSLWVHAGAGNNGYTTELANETGFQIMEKNRCNPSDPVCNIAGGNGSLNNVLKSTVTLPCTLMCGPDSSPHTLPYQRPGEDPFRQFTAR